MTRRVTLLADSDAWGGAEVYLSQLARRAADYGWSASVVAAEPVAARMAHGVAPVAVASVPLSRHRATAPAMRSAVAAQRPDAILVNLVDPGSNAAALGAALSLAPAVAVLHLSGALPSGAPRRALADVYGRLAALVSPSADGKRQLIADLAVPPRRVHVIPNGVDAPSRPLPLPRRAVARVGALGRLTEQKGFDLLIDATREVVADGTPVEVLIGGEGRDADRLRAASHGLPVRLCGFVSDVRNFLRGLDLFCLPSRHEALPLALLEAMAEGRPCVVTDVGAVAASVADDALVVPREDVAGLAGALRALLLDPGRRQALGAAAHRRVSRELTAELMARRTYAVLSRALAGRAG